MRRGGGVAGNGETAGQAGVDTVGVRVRRRAPTLSAAAAWSFTEETVRLTIDPDRLTVVGEYTFEAPPDAPDLPILCPFPPIRRSGARWGLDSAEAVLRLRALRGNGDLDDYLGYHFQQEKHRNHDSRYQQICDLAA